MTCNLIDLAGSSSETIRSRARGSTFLPEVIQKRGKSGQKQAKQATSSQLSCRYLIRQYQTLHILNDSIRGRPTNMATRHAHKQFYFFLASPFGFCCRLWGPHPIIRSLSDQPQVKAPEIAAQNKSQSNSFWPLLADRMF